MQRAESALEFIDSDDRETWIMAGMAIKDEWGDAGWEIWDRWSRLSDKYSKKSAIAAWKSFRRSGITMGSLYQAARRNGWVDDGTHQKPSPKILRDREIAARIRRSEEGVRRALDADRAARKAGWILKQCKMERHAYLSSKGFPDTEGMVWRKTENENLLVIPMRRGRTLTGCQLIDRDGVKRFLYGQECSLAEYVIDSGGMDWFCEGYASGLSLREVLSALKLRYRIHICFSAMNLKNIAAGYTSGYVVADNDESKTGEKVAIDTRLPYWMSDVEGEDVNDAHRRLGIFRLSQNFKTWMNKNGKQGICE